MSAATRAPANGTARAAEQAEPHLPVATFAEARMLLRRPFTPAAVKWKIQSEFAKKAMIVGYIDARLVIERLNLVVGGAWTAEYEPTNRGLMWCHLTVLDTTRRDVGEGTGKALVSDALKRAAVHFGIGVSLYAIPRTVMPHGNGSSALRLNSKSRPYLDDSNEAWLRQRYAKWLEATGVDAFGLPFDHGDAEDGSLGDPDLLRDEAPEQEPAPESVEVITAERAAELVDFAATVGVTDKLQLAASHAHGSDIGDCSTSEAAAKALAVLTVPQAEKLHGWIGKKADELAERVSGGSS